MLSRALILACLFATPSLAAEPAFDSSKGDALAAEYFRLESAKLTQETAERIPDLADPKVRTERRRQLRDMLGLDPLPERTPLNAVTTGVLDHPQFSVEKVQFQSSPGLYVTGNLYVPKNLTGKVPAVLYVCGHSLQKKDGISYGNKAGYQHHGAWFARNGYVCLTIDTLQLGEIEGIHHGLLRENRWWWLARGYTSAGVEAWNCIRALDYLETRPEVDAKKIGVTGRSGGGAYSWWILGIDDRIQAAVPVAGITSLENHVVDGCITGHCDCMFQVNTYRWDYSMIPGLFAPKPLLIANTDKDKIFPLNGVYDVYMKTRGVYSALKAEPRLGLQITEGPHKDTQELQVHAFVWMNRFLKGEEAVIEHPAVKFFEPSQLRVFDELPKDEINTRVDQVFVPTAPTPSVPRSRDEWDKLATSLREGLNEKVFRGWPEHEPSTSELEIHQISNPEGPSRTPRQFEFTSQRPWRLPFWVIGSAVAGKDGPVRLVILDDAGWEEADLWLSSRAPGSEISNADATKGSRAREWEKFLKTPGSTLVLTTPRGIGLTEWTRDKLARTHLRRRFALLGQTDDGMRAWDVRCALKAVRSLAELQGRPIELVGTGDASVWSLYASLYEPPVSRLTLSGLPATHAEGPVLLNILRVLDLPAAIALAAAHSPVTLVQPTKSISEFAGSTATAIKGDAIQIHIEP